MSAGLRSDALWLNLWTIFARASVKTLISSNMWIGMHVIAQISEIAEPFALI